MSYDQDTWWPDDVVWFTEDGEPMDDYDRYDMYEAMPVNPVASTPGGRILSGEEMDYFSLSVIRPGVD